MKLNNKYAFDLECTTAEPSQCYLATIVRLDQLEFDKVKAFDSIEGLINYIFQRANGSTMYAHNLKYDSSFILSWLMQNKKGKFEITSNIILPLTKNVLQLTIAYNGKTIKFQDTVCLFSAPLSKVMKAYTTIEKGETPIFERMSDVRLSNAVLEYAKKDSLGLGLALVERLKYGKSAITTASGAFKEFKGTIQDKYGKGSFENFFKPIPLEIEQEMRKAYRGGYTYLNPRYKEKVLHNVTVIDVNSMYPAQMNGKMLPYGEPIEVEGEVKPNTLTPLGIQVFSVESAAIKDNAVPFLSNSNTFLATNVYKEIVGYEEDLEDRTFSLTLEEFKLFKECYNYTGLKLIKGWLFKGRKDLFSRYIEKFWAMKSNPDKTISTLGKLFLNSLYGKFAEGYTKQQLEIGYEDKITYYHKSDEIRECGYLPVGIFITSYSRIFLLESIRSVGVNNFIYCDTDSIHFYKKNGNDRNIEYHDTELGKWSIDGEFKRAYYIRAKRYIGEGKDGKLKIACAGIKKFDLEDQIKRFEDFKQGKQISTIEFKMGRNGMYTRPKVITI